MKKTTRQMLTVFLMSAPILGLVACKNSLLDRSLIFTTNTTTGLEISANPVEAGGSPVKMVLGYKRQELAIVPVYDRYGTNGAGQHTTRTTNSTSCNGQTEATQDVMPSEAGTGPKYRAEAYSVIAKIASNVGGSANSSARYNTQSGTLASEGSVGADGHLNNAQWFATGQAAKTLAEQPGIVGAVVGSPAIAKASVESGKGLSGFVGEGRAFAMSSIALLYESISRTADDGDTLAESIRSRFNQAAASIKLPDTKAYTLYEREEQLDPNGYPLTDPNGDPLQALKLIDSSDFESSLSNTTTAFDQFLVFSEHLRKSARSIKAELADSKVEIFDSSSAAIELTDPSLKSLLSQEANRQLAANNGLAKALSQNTLYREALTEYFSNYILGKKESK